MMNKFMTQDEQNDVDVSRMMSKRANALKLLDDFKKWYIDEPKSGSMLVVMGLTRDILRGTETEIDTLTTHLEERNQAAFFKKMSQNTE